MVITFLPDSSSATMSSVFVLTAKPLLAACSTTSASSAMISALSFVARTPVGGRPTIVPASTSAFEGLKTKTPTSSSSGSSITSRSWAEPTAPVAHWITRVVTWTWSARRAPRPCRASRSYCRREAPGEPRGTRSRPIRCGGLVVVPTAGPRTHTNRKSSSAPLPRHGRGCHHRERLRHLTLDHRPQTQGSIPTRTRRSWAAVMCPFSSIFHTARQMVDRAPKWAQGTR